MEIKCCICNFKHSLGQLIECDFRFGNIIKKYLDIDLTYLVYIPDKKKYKCESCNSKFHSLTNYKYHLKHNVCKKIIKKYQCEKCSKVFQCKRNLKYHNEFSVCKKLKCLNLLL